METEEPLAPELGALEIDTVLQWSSLRILDKRKEDAFYYVRIHKTCLDHGIDRISWTMSDDDAYVLYAASGHNKYLHPDAMKGWLVNLIGNGLNRKTNKPRLFEHHVDETVRPHSRGRRYYVPLDLDATDHEQA